MKRIREIRNVSHPMGKKVTLYDSELVELDRLSDNVSRTSAMAR